MPDDRISEVAAAEVRLAGLRQGDIDRLWGEIGSARARMIAMIEARDAHLQVACRLDVRTVKGLDVPETKAEMLAKLDRLLGDHDGRLMLQLRERERAASDSDVTPNPEDKS